MSPLLFLLGTFLFAASNLQSATPSQFLMGLATSPLIMAVLLITTRSPSLSLTLHQVLATFFWISFYLLTTPTQPSCQWCLPTSPSPYATYYVATTLSIFLSELLLLPPSLATTLHHATSPLLITLGYLAFPLHSPTSLLTLTHFLAISCPSYTCLPKLLAHLNTHATIVDGTWITALSLWTFWRVPTLISVYGHGFDGLRTQFLIDVQTTHVEADLTKTTCAPTASYYTHAAITAGLSVLYLINLYWCYTKLRSIAKTVGKYTNPRNRRDTPPPACYHGGRSWETSGLVLADRGTRMVVADVLDAYFPPAPGVGRVIVEACGEKVGGAGVRASPPTDGRPLIETIAEVQGLRPCDIIVSSGSSSIMFSILPRLIKRGGRVLTITPTYGEYGHVFASVCEDVAVVNVPIGPHMLAELSAEVVGGGFDLVVIVNPNSPTGDVWDLRPFVKVCDANDTVVWVDETYIDYAIASQPSGAVVSCEGLIKDCSNLLVCKSMSKSHSLSGLRVAYLAGRKCGALRRWIPPWSVSLLGVLGGIEALKDGAYYREEYRKVARERERVVGRLREAGCTVRDGVANFYSVKVQNVAIVVRYCQEVKQVFVRGLEGGWVRCAVRSREENGRIVEALLEAVERNGRKKKKEGMRIFK